MEAMQDALPRVVVLGGGFAGLYAARTLRKQEVHLTVIDRRNHHLFQPLLYQVATAALNPSDIAAPIRRVLRRQKNASVILGEAIDIDVDGKKVILTDGTVAYDYLIIATGATHSYFGNEQWARHAPGLKTLDDALDVRRRMLLAFEAAERETDDALRLRWMTFVIVGGGPTGVELAGAMAEIARHTVARDFRNIDPRATRVILIEGLDRILPSFPTDLSASAERQLVKLGVEVLHQTLVTSVDAAGVQAGDERIDAGLVVWAAGVKASDLLAKLPVERDRAGRVLVGEDLAVPGLPHVFVIGDAAYLEQDGQPVPGVAPAAIQEGKHTGKNILRLIKGETSSSFRYRDKGSLATIGRAAAVADLGKLHLSGFVAWAAWIVVHLFYLIGFRNRLIVMLEWAWEYLTWDKGARLITGDIFGGPKRPPSA
jgi:NADH dehydrogenase